MDSVSQIVLGASLAHITLGKHLGSRALLLGAALGTLPDLDVLVPYDDAIANFTFHRSWSHSLFTLTALSFPLAWLCFRFLPRRQPSAKSLTPHAIQQHGHMSGQQASYAQWLLGVWLILITHPLLDGFTVYGTQIWWPLPLQPTAWGSIFIIDPLYTVPLIIAVILAWRRPWARSTGLVLSALLISTSYLAWTLYAQHSTRGKLMHTLAAENINANHIFIAPFPFSLLWRSVVVTDNEYREGYSSLLDSNDRIELDVYDNGHQACKEWLTHWPVKRLEWFTNGAFAMSVQNEQLVASDLRMGIEDDYVFEFAVAQWQDNEWQMIVTRQQPINIDGARFALLFKRMFDEGIDLTPIAPIRHEQSPDCKPYTIDNTVN